MCNGPAGYAHITRYSVKEPAGLRAGKFSYLLNHISKCDLSRTCSNLLQRCMAWIVELVQVFLIPQVSGTEDPHKNQVLLMY